ncbi:MAG TPA: adenylyltransferase/cytidyltransferase family protein [Candidatus Nanoarchaeia archaeon]|nr:adenylyltransferase/cytidyltransferase family protein [Candidatus Nanoarchaeia archaeon]
MGKVLSLVELKLEVENLRKKGKKIVVTNGVFDLIHIAHLHILKKCKSMGDILIVLINSDYSVKRYKGDKRPILNENDRAELLAAFSIVDYVCIFPEDTPLKALEEIKPNILAKGGAYIPERVKAEEELLKKWSGKLITFPLEKEYSSTNIIKKVLQAYQDEHIQSK